MFVLLPLSNLRKEGRRRVRATVVPTDDAGQKLQNFLRVTSFPSHSSALPLGGYNQKLNVFRFLESSVVNWRGGGGLNARALNVTSTLLRTQRRALCVLKKMCPKVPK